MGVRVCVLHACESVILKQGRNLFACQHVRRKQIESTVHYKQVCEVNFHICPHSCSNQVWKLPSLCVCVCVRMWLSECARIISFCCLSLLLRSHLELRLSFLRASWHFFPPHCLSGFHHLFSISVSLSLSLPRPVLSPPPLMPLSLSLSPSPLLYLVSALHCLFFLMVSFIDTFWRTDRSDAHELEPSSNVRTLISRRRDAVNKCVRGWHLYRTRRITLTLYAY